MSLSPATALKPRYDLLDGLRGVAAVMVIWYHFFEGFATSPVDQRMNHGYLAVDFFFVLSGFVIGYAYDDRWRRGLTAGGFMLRRVIRLQPMVVFSVILGAAAYLLQGSVQWDGTPIPLHNVLIALALGLFMIPALPFSMADVRGNGEMFSLNGPAWSLFFEYIGSVLYALALHRLSTRALRAVVVLSGLGLAVAACTNLSGAYHIGFGWSMADWGWIGGFLRLLFSFSAGMLMSRGFKAVRVRGAFWICSALIVATMACPYVTGADGGPSVLNALYDSACTLFLFPAIVWLGACGSVTDRFSAGTCSFLGRLSYPVYIVHYPAMYLFYAWVWGNALTFDSVWPVCVAIFVGIIIFAWLVMRFYDEPVRRYLSRKLL